MTFSNTRAYTAHMTGALALCAMTFLATSASAQDIEEMTAQGNLGFGVNATFNYTNSQNQILEGRVATDNSATNANLFMLVLPELGYFISDRVQLALNVGYLLRRLQRDEAQNASTESNWMFTGGVRYHIPFTPRFSFIPGIGAGFYVGSSSRDIIVNINGVDTTTNEGTDTYGLDLNTTMNFGYLIGERTELQAGFQVHYLYGVESIESAEENLSVSTFNVGLNLGVFYYF